LPPSLSRGLPRRPARPPPPRRPGPVSVVQRSHDDRRRNGVVEAAYQQLTDGTSTIRHRVDGAARGHAEDTVETPVEVTRRAAVGIREQGRNLPPPQRTQHVRQPLLIRAAEVAL